MVLCSHLGLKVFCCLVNARRWDLGLPHPLPTLHPQSHKLTPCSRQVHSIRRGLPPRWPGRGEGSEHVHRPGVRSPTCSAPGLCRNCASTCPTLPTSAPARTTQWTHLWSSFWTTCTTPARWARSSMGCSTARTTNGKGQLQSSWSLGECLPHDMCCCTGSSAHAWPGSAGAWRRQPITCLGTETPRASVSALVLNLALTHKGFSSFVSPQPLHNWHNEPGYLFYS